ncbi:hypothetical protein IB286_14495 [Spongiibacter sp. KMU-158]|uniref:RepA protein n=1 Tax=Spongiibacter pelagi TaxID=2760804 RepID=A0A927GXN9_9GAMM|nr:replication protein RepA [Spongiibacter pelagi]MBD2860207.1 hypothetical protein [Spongiibacter pelagi]|tara:strand:- start:183 stop:1277 length:1095 start_codon:yes stop_codon:yes gene_type:complete
MSQINESAALAFLVESAKQRDRAEEGLTPQKYIQESTIDASLTAAYISELLAKGSENLPINALNLLPQIEFDKLSDAEIYALSQNANFQADADKAFEAWFLPSPIVQTGLPLRKVSGEQRQIRRNGDLTVEFVCASSDHHLPYGMPARIVLAFLSTQAVQTKNRTIVIGDTLKGFLEDSVGVKATKGERGSYKRFGETLLDMCHLVINHRAGFEKADQGKTLQGEKGGNIPVVSSHALWGESNYQSELGGVIKLSQEYYDLATQHAVPIAQDDFEKLVKLGKPLAFDIYSWCHYRQHAMGTANRRVSNISWPQLYAQMGSEFPQRSRFSAAFRESLDLLQKENLVQGIVADKSKVMLIRRSAIS